jgi:hypothetical protein
VLCVIISCVDVILCLRDVTVDLRRLRRRLGRDFDTGVLVAAAHGRRRGARAGLHGLDLLVLLLLVQKLLLVDLLHVLLEVLLLQLSDQRLLLQRETTP